MILLLHPTMLWRAAEATEFARKHGGEWEVKRGYCKFRYTGPTVQWSIVEDRRSWG